MSTSSAESKVKRDHLEDFGGAEDDDFIPLWLPEVVGDLLQAQEGAESDPTAAIATSLNETFVCSTRVFNSVQQTRPSSCRMSILASAVFHFIP